MARCLETEYSGKYWLEKSELSGKSVILDEKLCDLCRSASTVRTVKSRRLRGAGRVAVMGRQEMQVEF